MNEGRVRIRVIPRGRRSPLRRDRLEMWSLYKQHYVVFQARLSPSSITDLRSPPSIERSDLVLLGIREYNYNVY